MQMGMECFLIPRGDRNGQPVYEPLTYTLAHTSWQYNVGD